ncbi:AAA family ATPase [Gryllotalpicola reticulitermitis]|uniref:AAA family ATPase n=1 Tax=Gryllotalpicola reticulitermitis TaxID=1184153 RepID=A0ABV8QDI7_9MICO
MSDSVVLLNGVPGAGKTTLATPLARQLGVPLIGKDAIKESLADLVSQPLPTSQLGALASDVMWSLAALVDGVVIVESFWATGRDEKFLRAGLCRAGAGRAVEVWCEVPIGVARERFLTRERHPAHKDAERLAEWEAVAAVARPCSGQPTLPVRTDAIVNVALLVERIRALLDDESARLPAA